MRRLRRSIQMTCRYCTPSDARLREIQTPSFSFQVQTGLADAYIANGKPEEAVKHLLALKAARSGAKSLPAKTASEVDAAATSSKDREAAGPDAAVSTSAAAPSSSATSVDSAALELLLAKVYGSWRGHDNDALATYDALIKTAPEDFRAYLAKGLFLKEHGRKADAERMFIQVAGEGALDVRDEDAS